MRRISGLAALFAVGAAPVPTSDLSIEIADLRSDRGVVMICLTATPANFPDCHARADARFLNLPANRPTGVFAQVPSGNWAVAAIHDQDGDGRLDTLLGVPREGIGFSRNPRLGFGPPTFKSAAVVMNGNGQREIVRMRYFL